MTKPYYKPTKTTIKDVASLARVTPGTVSLALNYEPNQISISPETIQRIQLAAKKLNYHPNMYATRLVKGIDAHPTITVMTPIPEGFGGFHNQNVLSAIFTNAAKLGINVNLRNTIFDSSGTPVVASMGDPSLTDGIILHTWLDFPDQVVNELVAAGKPFVLANHYVDNPAIPCVGGEMFSAGKKIAEYILDFGHTDIAVILGPAAFCKVTSYLAGIRSTVTAHGLSLPDSMVQFGSYDVLNKPALYQLINSTPRPTAIICISDSVALSVVGALTEIGLSVPHDMSVTGFGNDSFSALMHPQLTTMDETGNAIGTKAMNLLFDLIEGKTPDTKIKLDFSIVIRETCSYLRQRD